MKSSISEIDTEYKRTRSVASEPSAVRIVSMYVIGFVENARATARRHEPAVLVETKWTRETWCGVAAASQALFDWRVFINAWRRLRW